jgi:DNA repair protein RadD
MAIQLRHYQQAAIQSIYDWFGTRDGNPLVVLPTGTGKSLVIAGLCQKIISDFEDSKILVVTHVRELIAQNYAELLQLWPDAPAGINSAGIGKRDTRQQIVFCGIQSVSEQAHKFGAVDLVLVDEAHLIPRDGATRYQKFISDLKVANPHLRVIGLTATPFRLDSGRLDEGDDALFEGVAYEYSVLKAVEEQYLSRVVSKATETLLDTTGVGTRGGEFIASELQRAVDIDATNQAAISEVIARAKVEDRRSWLVFGSGVEHCQHLAAIIRERGFSCGEVYGDTPKGERDATIAAFKRGELTAITSMGVLTTGFNAPAVDLIAMLRPTQSTGLYVQIVGRGMRLAPNKRDCLVLDFAGNIHRHGPIDAVAPKSPKKSEGPGEAPVKTCPSCGSHVHAAASECIDCGFVFPKREPKIEQRAAIAPIMSDATPSWVVVEDVTFSRHQKIGKPDSLAVTYHLPRGGAQREWICIEHDGYARQKAEQWWRLRAGTRMPKSVSEALSRTSEIKVPGEILLRRNGKYMEVVNARNLSLRSGGAGVSLEDAASEDAPF